MATATTNTAVDNHKCLLYWHARNMGSIPLVNGKDQRRMILYPGYNTVDSVYLEGIFKECADQIESGRLEVKGCTYKDGKVIESFQLAKVSAKEFMKILSCTYSPDALLDLADTNNVPALLTTSATSRRKALDEATGNEPDNIEVRGEETHGL